MNCPNQVLHTLQRGDTLYRLAKRYHTDVESILMHNPAISSLNFRVGKQILICPGKEYKEQPIETEQLSDYFEPITGAELSKRMRLAWVQHVYWTRLLLISISGRLNDHEAVTDRLMRNPYDIAGIFANFYPQDVAQEIADLLTEHLQIGADLITAQCNGNEEATSLTRNWYNNADRMAEAFASINPYYDREALRDMLHTHLNLTTQGVMMRLAGDYLDDIEAFDKVEEVALMMADYFTNGIERATTGE